MERLIDEKEAARLTGFSVYYFQAKRCKGGGPPFIKVGARSVRYRMPEMMEWFASHGIVNSTSQYPPPPPRKVLPRLHLIKRLIEIPPQRRFARLEYKQ